MESPCKQCQRLTSTVYKFAGGSVRVNLCSEACLYDYRQAGAHRVEIARWTYGSEHSEMVQVGRELQIRWCNARNNRRVVFNLDDVRVGDVSILSDIVEDIYAALRWMAPAPGTASESAPREATLYPIETQTKYLHTIEELIH